LAGIAAAALLALAIYRWRTAGFHWQHFASTFHNVSWTWLAAAIITILLTYAGRALRWSVMVRPLRPNPSVWNIFSATVVGFTAIVLFGRPGEFVRPYLISLKEQVPFSSQMAAWVLERILDLLMVLLLFGVALMQISNTGLSPGPHLRTVLQTGGYIVGLTGAGCLVLLIGFRHFSEPLSRRLCSAITFLPLSYQRKITSVLGAFVQGLESTRQNGFVGLLFLWSALEWALIVACFICIFKAFPATKNFTVADILIFMGFVSLGAAIQIPGVGGGMQVAAILVLTELFGFTLETAAGIALALWIITFVVVVPFGLLLAFHEGLNWRKLTHLAEDASAS
jgi:uncharacterized protein (TIRG00374 family)